MDHKRYKKDRKEIIDVIREIWNYVNKINNLNEKYKGMELDDQTINPLFIYNYKIRKKIKKLMKRRFM